MDCRGWERALCAHTHMPSHYCGEGGETFPLLFPTGRRATLLAAGLCQVVMPAYEACVVKEEGDQPVTAHQHPLLRH